MKDAVDDKQEIKKKKNCFVKICDTSVKHLQKSMDSGIAANKINGAEERLLYIRAISDTVLKRSNRNIVLNFFFIYNRKKPVVFI